MNRPGFVPSGIKGQSREDFLNHLKPIPDVGLSDYTKPDSSGLTALRLMKEQKVDFPIIFVSASIIEKFTVTALNEGTTYYLITYRFARLGQTIEHEMAHFLFKVCNLANERTVARSAALVYPAAESISVLKLDGLIFHWNTDADCLCGYLASETVRKVIAILIPLFRRESEFSENSEEMPTFLGQGAQVEAFEAVRTRNDGQRVDLSVSISLVRDSAGVVVAASLNFQNIGRRKRVKQLFFAEQGYTRFLTLPRTVEAYEPKSGGAVSIPMRQGWQDGGHQRILQPRTSSTRPPNTQGTGQHPQPYLAIRR